MTVGHSDNWAPAGLDFGVFGPPKLDRDPARGGHSVTINLPKANAPQKTDDDADDAEEGCVGWCASGLGIPPFNIPTPEPVEGCMRGHHTASA